MSESNPVAREKLVEIHKARNEWEGVLLAGYLRNNGIEAAFQGDANVTLDMQEMLQTSDEAFGLYVLEHEAVEAKALLAEFMAAATDPSVMEETAARKLKVDKETIAQLRSALREERRTFEFLGWLSMAFFAAAATLWVIWPGWLKIEAPSAVLRWAMVALLVLGAFFAGNWTSKRL